MNPTIKLLRVVGSPFVPVANEPEDIAESQELFTYAIKNRMPLLYLETLKRWGRLDKLKVNYEERCARYIRIVDEAVKVSKFLDRLDVEHAVVKTFTSFPSTPNDIDILCLGKNSEYDRAVKAMFQAGYEQSPFVTFPQHLPRQIKLHQPRNGIWIDLHKEMGASRLILIDKKRLVKHVIELKLPNGETVKALTPQADLSIIMLHSLLVEQVHTLAEFWTTLCWLDKMDGDGIDSFIRVVRENNMVVSARTHIGITMALHDAAYDTVPDKLIQLASKLGRGTSETERFIKNSLKMPHKYGMLTLANALVEKVVGESVTRKSIIPQMVRMLNPVFTWDFLKEAWDHYSRETQGEQFFSDDK